MIEIDPRCTGPFTDARDCPVHRPMSLPTPDLAALRATVAALDPVVIERQIETASDAIDACREAVRATKHVVLTLIDAEIARCAKGGA